MHLQSFGSVDESSVAQGENYTFTTAFRAIRKSQANTSLAL